mmetsp:Transcript_3679/g.13572  ORF Transcript_3679/g.13572 Transcript_3679/m.13572 type:complete len:318 (+) Transcript_3679:44-997(+)
MHLRPPQRPAAARRPVNTPRPRDAKAPWAAGRPAGRRICWPPRRRMLPSASSEAASPSQAEVPRPLEDAVRVARPDDDDHAARLHLAALCDDALVHRLVPGGCHRVVDLWQHVHLDEQHDVRLDDVLVFRLDGPGRHRRFGGAVAEELQDLVGDGARTEAGDEEGDPRLQREAGPVQEHAPDDVDVVAGREEHLEGDPRECQPSPQAVQKVARRGQHGHPQATPKPIQVHVDAGARDAARRSGLLGGQELRADLDGETLDHPVENADARKHKRARLAEPETQSAPRVVVGEDLEVPRRRRSRLPAEVPELLALRLRQ